MKECLLGEEKGRGDGDEHDDDFPFGFCWGGRGGIEKHVSVARITGLDTAF